MEEHSGDRCLSAERLNKARRDERLNLKCLTSCSESLPLAVILYAAITTSFLATIWLDYDVRYKERRSWIGDYSRSNVVRTEVQAKHTRPERRRMIATAEASR